MPSSNSLEDKLLEWTKPSSDTEQKKQDRTKRMIREAIRNHPGFEECKLHLFVKGSYANNTNVRTDSDVDIAVECQEAICIEGAAPGLCPPITSYTGQWTPEKLRSELVAALEIKFPGEVDTSGSTAIQIDASSARVNADVVPCFPYQFYHSSHLPPREGTKIFTTSGQTITNYPAQQLKNGKDKNKRTDYAYKKVVRILKRVENALAANGLCHALPSYFIECLVYNCPDTFFTRMPTWKRRTMCVLWCLLYNLEGDEPVDHNDRWLEVDGYSYLFTSKQKWKRHDGQKFAHAAWEYLFH